MADFCKDCSIEVFGVDCEDFAGVTTKEQYDGGNGSAMVVLCEGCGVIAVDPDGKRIDPVPFYKSKLN